ncbi:hypothetical protein [Streptomyces sp. NPDC000878]
MPDTLTLTPAQAREQLTTARAEADEAAALIDVLAERVRSGDTEITADQMASQKQLAELAGLRVTAAERKLKAAQAADLDARARATSDRIHALVKADSADPIATAVRAVIGSVQALVTAAADRHTTIRDVSTEGVRINEELGRSDNNPWPSRAYDFVAQDHPSASVAAVGVGRAEAVPAHRLLAVALAQALGDQGGMRSQLARELAGTREGFAHTAGLIPGLVDALQDSEG